MLKLLNLIESHGANLGAPHTAPMGDGLFEVRAKAKEGIGRALFCYMKGENICILHAFVKKTQKTPKKELDLAKARIKEVSNND
jgi:phage-related protein